MATFPVASPATPHYIAEPMAPTQETRPRLFDMAAHIARRDRAARSGAFAGADFLHRTAAEEIADRLSEVTRDFADALVVGSGGGAYAAALAGRVPGITQVEPSLTLAEHARSTAPGARTVTAPLDPLPIAEKTADLAISGLWLHWADDPVGALIQMRRALRPDGLMIAAMFGGNTLSELRTALAEAEAELTGGLSPRVAPMGELRDLGALLQRAGYAMPVADSLRLTATYGNAFALMRELRAMGETNALAERLRRPTRRAVLLRAAEIYAKHFSTPEGRVRASFEIVMLTGWAPGPGQPEPKRPGSATTRLADALGAVELPTGEKAGPRKG